MNIVILTNDNYFSYVVLKDFLPKYKDQIKLVVFSSALIGKKGTGDSIKWSLKNTGFRHTAFKLGVYGVFRLMRFLCGIFPFIKNNYSSMLWVQKNKISHVITSNINSDQLIEKIQSVKPDLIISVSMNQIVKKTILEIPSRKSINVHCAPLPRYAGMSPYVWALANNEEYSAATIHYMEEGLDEGDIIVQKKIPIQKNDSAFDLFCRCCKTAAQELRTVVEQIAAGKVSSFPQDLSQRSYYSWPTRECIKQLKKNGYYLATLKDYYKAIFK